MGVGHDQKKATRSNRRGVFGASALFALERVRWLLCAVLLLVAAAGDAQVVQAPKTNNGAAAAFYEAIDRTIELSSGATSASRVPICVQSLKDLMVRAGIPMDADRLRGNLTDAELLRLGLLASIALISPWDQNPQSGKFFIAEHSGVLVEAFHPSSSESDIMLCVVCSLLAVIVMFHVTNTSSGGQLPQELLQPTVAAGSKGH